MKVDTSYILQHSVLTREVFIITYIQRYMEDLKMIYFMKSRNTHNATD